jgi:hypothetical protein
MKIREVVLIAASIGIGVFVIAAVTLPALPGSHSFNLSRTLPTGTTYFNGQPNCGPNETARMEFPSNGVINYWITQNESDASVNIWWQPALVLSFGSASFTASFLSTGFGHDQGNLPSGDYTIVFKACGPTTTVSLGFWGVANYSVPLL